MCVCVFHHKIIRNVLLWRKLVHCEVCLHVYVAKPCNGIPVRHSTNCTGVLTKFPKYQNYNVCCGR